VRWTLRPPAATGNLPHTYLACHWQCFESLSCFCWIQRREPSTPRAHSWNFLVTARTVCARGRRRLLFYAVERAKQYIHPDNLQFEGNGQVPRREYSFPDVEGIAMSDRISRTHVPCNRFKLQTKVFY
jgi:hypothetical protein